MCDYDQATITISATNANDFTRDVTAFIQKHLKSMGTGGVLILHNLMAECLENGWSGSYDSQSHTSPLLQYDRNISITLPSEDESVYTLLITKLQ